MMKNQSNLLATQEHDLLLLSRAVCWVSPRWGLPVTVDLYVNTRVYMLNKLVFIVLVHFFHQFSHPSQDYSSVVFLELFPSKWFKIAVLPKNLL